MDIKTTKNGKLLFFCSCAECGITKTKFVSAKKGAGNPALDAAKHAKTAVRKILPSTNHIFDRYWSGKIVKNAFTGPTGITSKEFWTYPKKGTVMETRKNPKTGKWENFYN